MNTSPSKYPFNIPPHLTPEGCLQQPMTKQQAQDVVNAGTPAEDADCLEWSNYGAALYLARRDEEALAAVRWAVSLGRNATTLLNLGVVLEGFGKFPEALHYFEEAQAMDPASLMAGGAYADGLLRIGNWRTGWPFYSLYHSRLLIDHVPTLAEISGKRLIVIKNGKIGDNIYHLRWFKYLHEAGCHITYVCDAELIPLFRNHLWIDTLLAAPCNEGVIRWYVDGPPTFTEKGTLHFNLREFDYILSVMSLPTIISTVMDGASWPGAPYIHARVPWYRRIMPHSKLQIGFCWKAGESGFPRAHRSLSPQQFESMVRQNTHLNWIGLVPDGPVPTGLSVTPRLRNWMDTAQVIAACDLVVTVDTGVAHLAAAMGKPVWVILCGASAWQYGIDDEYKSIYPTMRVFRNHGVGTDQSFAACMRTLRNLDAL